MQALNAKDKHLIIPMSPGEENDIIIRYNIYDAFYGKSLIASTDKGICFIAFGEETVMTDELRERYSKATFVKQNSDLHILALSLMENPASKIDLPFHIKGTDFQLRVWNKLLLIPTGRRCSYKHIAEQLGQPKATRAVGTAIGLNPVSCLIPCHRVVPSDNTLGGYHWGSDVKKKMLNHELSR